MIDPDESLLQRIRDHAAHGGSDAGPPVRVDPARYLDPARFGSERALFRRVPVPLFAASRVAEPGSWATHDATGVPILAARGRDGELRAFVNACRHRGTRLADGGGQGNGFTCPYHGWSYDDAGALRGLPGADQFPHVDLGHGGQGGDQCGLVRLPIATALGLAFGVATPGAPLDLRATWGAPVVDELERLGLEHHVGYAERTIEVAASWKLAIDASLENYHVPVAHRATIAPMFLRGGLVGDRFPGAVRVVFPKRSIASTDGTARLRDHANVVWWLLPGLLVLVEPDHVQIMAVYPTALDRMRVEGVTLIPEAPTSDKVRRHWDRNVELFWTTIAEDFAMMERVQRGIAHVPALHFGTTEHAVAWAHEILDARIRG